MMFMSLSAARELGLAVGIDPRIGITESGVVIVSERMFDAAEAQRAACICDMDGEAVYLPPFELEP